MMRLLPELLAHFERVVIFDAHGKHSFNLRLGSQRYAGSVLAQHLEPGFCESVVKLILRLAMEHMSSTPGRLDVLLTMGDILPYAAEDPRPYDGSRHVFRKPIHGRVPGTVCVRYNHVWMWPMCGFSVSKVAMYLHTIRLAPAP